MSLKLMEGKSVGGQTCFSLLRLEGRWGRNSKLIVRIASASMLSCPFAFFSSWCAVSRCDDE